MWIGKGAFEDYGYYKHPAYMKGTYSNLDPAKCYRILDAGAPNTTDQFHVVPVDANGNETGPAAFKTAGQVMYSIWQAGRHSSDYDISDEYIP